MSDLHSQVNNEASVAESKAERNMKNVNSEPLLPSTTTNFCISKFGQWNLKLNRKTAEDFDLIQQYVIRPQPPDVEVDPNSKTRKLKKKKLTPYDHMQKARANKHAKDKEVVAEDDEDVEIYLNEMYEDFQTAHPLGQESPEKADETAQTNENRKSKKQTSWLTTPLKNIPVKKSATFLSVERNETIM